MAARASLIAEEAHSRLAPRIGWTPRARTRLIIADDADAAGGWATPYPYNQIMITPTPPLGEYGLGTTRHDDWLRLVITHEYTHILQLDLASRLPLTLRSIFGRLYFPNSLQPLWLIEGLATFEETELTAGGRGRSPGSAMILRMAALEGPFPTLDQMGVLPDAWPAGQIPYLFGESFLRYLAGRFGRDKIADISRVYGGRALPFMVEPTGRTALGEDYQELWRQWSAELRERSLALKSTVSARGLSPSTALTTDGRFNGSAAWSPDGSRIAWLHADGKERPGIWVMNPDGSGRQLLMRLAFSTTSSGATLSWSPDGRRLYFTKPGVLRGAAAVNDIWAWDFDRGAAVRITRALRARDAHPSPDGRTLALITIERGLTRLALLDLDGKLPARTAARLRPLTEFSADQLAEPRWSPDGRRIVVSAWMPGGEREIRTLDREGRLLARVGHEHALDGAPAWSADGRRLFFSSDITGIYNIFSWDSETSDIVQVTNVLGGAFSPAPSPDGRRLAFADYSARGFDIRVMELSDAALPPAADEGPQREDPAALTGTGKSLAPEDRNPADAGFSSTSYSPLDTILPRFWLPWSSYSTASGTLGGFVTGGQDVLQRHTYSLTGLYGPKNGRLMHWFDYTYEGLRPTLRLFSSDVDRTYADLLRDARGSADYAERRRTIGADVSLEFPDFDSFQAVTLGYRYRELSALDPLPAWSGNDDALPADGPLGSTHLAWFFANAHRQALSISPADGRSVELRIERYQEGFGSDYTFTRASLDWNEFVALPVSRHVLAARLFFGGSVGSPPPQGVFSLGGSEPGAVDFAPDDTSLLLRGYPPDTFRGERAVLAGLEYRFPLLEIERGAVSAPFFLRRLHGALFIDAGEAWTDGAFRTDDLHAGIGAELRLDMFFAYYLPLTVRVGVAAGLDHEGEVYPSLAISIPQGSASGDTGRERRRSR